MKKIKTIVFDLGGVLIDYDREACVKKFRELGFDNAEELIGPYSTAGCLLKLESGTIDREEFYNELIQSAPRPITVEQIDEAMYSFMLDIPEYKLDMLTDLRNRGYLLFMLSNTNPILMSLIKEQRFTIQGKTIDDYFDRLFSCAVQLISRGKAYVDHQTPAEIRRSREVAMRLSKGLDVGGGNRGDFGRRGSAGVAVA